MKRFVAVGINAYGGANSLQGCVNDAATWRDVLLGRGFVEHATLLDGDATRANIIDAWGSSLRVSKPGDTVVWCYSGHGTFVPDVDGDEADGRDEALVPVDFQAPGGGWQLILDDDIYALVTAFRKPGVNVLILPDACHSGTASRLVDLSRMSGLEGAPRVLTERMPRPRFLPPSEFMDGPDLARARAVEHAVVPAKPRTGAALMSACGDGQVAMDAWFGGRPNGAFTRAAVDALTTDRPRLLRAWLAATRVRNAYPQTQTPQAEGTWWQRNVTRWA